MISPLSVSNSAIPPSSLLRTSVRAMGWKTGSNISQFFAQFVIAVCLARLLEIEDFGVAAVALSFVGLASLVAQLGLPNALVRLPDLAIEDIRTCYALAIYSGSVIGIGVFVLSEPMAIFYGNTEIGQAIRFLSPLCLLNSLYGVAYAQLARRLDFRRLFLSNTISQLAGYGGVTLVLAFLGFGVWAILWGNLLRGFLNCILNLMFVRAKIRFTFCKASINKVWRLSGGMLMDGSLLYVVENVDYLLVGRILGAVNLGVYSRAYMLMSLPIGQLSSAVGAVLTVSYGGLDSDKLKQAFHLSVGLVGFAIFPCFVVFSYNASEIINLLYGPRWDAAALPFSILSLAGFGKVVANQSTALIRIRGSLSQLWGCHCINAFLLIVGVVVGSVWGVEGVAAGAAIGISLGAFSYLFVAQSVVGASWWEFLISLRPAVVTCCMLLAILSTTGHMLSWFLDNGTLVFFASTLIAVASSALTVILLKKWVFDRMTIAVLRKAWGAVRKKALVLQN